MEEFDHEKYKVAYKGADRGGATMLRHHGNPVGKGGRSVYESKILFLRKDILYLVRMDLYSRGQAAGQAYDPLRHPEVNVTGWQEMGDERPQEGKRDTVL